MNAPFTAYLEVEFDRTNEGDYEKQIWSADCPLVEVAAFGSLVHTTCTGYGYTVLGVSIIPADKVLQIPPSEHFTSFMDLAKKLGALIFRPKAKK